MSKARQALCELFVDLCLAFHGTTVPLGEKAGETDANLALVGVTVMLGHAEGAPMTATQISKRLQMPRTTVLRRLEILIDRNVLQRIGGQYFVETSRAESVAYRDTFTAILSKAFITLGPRLSKTDVSSKMDGKN